MKHLTDQGYQIAKVSYRERFFVQIIPANRMHGISEKSEFHCSHCDRWKKNHKMFLCLDWLTREMDEGVWWIAINVKRPKVYRNLSNTWKPGNGSSRAEAIKIDGRL